MPMIQTGDIQTYYEVKGDGRPMVLIHGGWVSHRMWEPQADYFARHWQVITYDVRGHGRTGGSSLNKYSIALFAEDPARLIAALELDKPAVCGLSMGGMIAQAYAVAYPDDLSALILCDTAASTTLTLGDKIAKYVLGPKWLFLSLVRLLGVKKYADFAFWYARKSRSDKWVGADRSVQDYEKEEMVQFGVREFNKIFAALYDFSLLELSRIKVKTLILNGEYESKSVFHHARKMCELIPDARADIVPGSGHTSNMENPEFFNRAVEEFLQDAM